METAVKDLNFYFSFVDAFNVSSILSRLLLGSVAHHGYGPVFYRSFLGSAFSAAGFLVRPLPAAGECADMIVVDPENNESVDIVGVTISKGQESMLEDAKKAQARVEESELGKEFCAQSPEAYATYWGMSFYRKHCQAYFESRFGD